MDYVDEIQENADKFIYSFAEINDKSGGGYRNSLSGSSLRLDLELVCQK